VAPGIGRGGSSPEPAHDLRHAQGGGPGRELRAGRVPTGSTVGHA